MEVLCDIQRCVYGPATGHTFERTDGVVKKREVDDQVMKAQEGD